MLYTNVDLGDRIRELRTRDGVSQRELSRAVGVSPNSISRIESGLQKPSGELIAAIADYFSVSADYLLGRAVHTEDLPDDLRELFTAAQKAGYAADLKEFFDWLAAKRDQLAARDEKVTREPDEELLALVPDLTEGEIKAILLKFKGDIVKRISKLNPDQTKVFNEEVAKILYYLELEAKVKRSGEIAEADTKRE